MEDGERVLNCGRVLTTAPYAAYVKISDGCDNRCTYCAIPLIRGGYASRPFGDIVEECARLAAEGVTEITLIAQDTSRYGCDFGEDVYKRQAYGCAALGARIFSADGFGRYKTVDIANLQDLQATSDGFVYYDGSTVSSMDTDGKVKWSYLVGSDAGFSATDYGGAAWTRCV